MKNIHIIPTNKPSRLAKHSSGSFHIVSYIAHKKGLYKMTNQNIYITSGEEIKEGDWVLNTNTNSIAKYTGHGSMDWWVKITLTTEQDLISDGVQAIDDEFLEWFVKNSSCEFVEVEFNNRGITGVEKILKTFGDYKIIIPQEEPKQIKCYCGHTITCDCEPLQETLEDAAKNTTKIYVNEREKQTAFLEFINGANWQSERMYSEEDMLKCWNAAYIDALSIDEETYKPLFFADFIEQFKKK
jgi:hypothetical protein